ncbi:hypothetical protein ABGB07_03810 [Micromonosporaceae bacterium B7E4]
MPATTDQVQAAYDRFERARAALDAADAAQRQAAAEHQAAGWEYLRLKALATPLREFLLDLLRRFDPGLDLAWLTKQSHRPAAEVSAALDELIRDGLARQHGKGYTAADS